MSTTTRRLVFAWLLLMALSLGLAIAADVRHASRLGPAWMLAVAAVTVLKSRIILGDYLALRHSRGAHLGFTAAIALTMAVVVGGFLAIGS
jgi:hypothetical protein